MAYINILIAIVSRTRKVSICSRSLDGLADPAGHRQYISQNHRGGLVGAEAGGGGTYKVTKIYIVFHKWISIVSLKRKHTYFIRFWCNNLF